MSPRDAQDQTERSAAAGHPVRGGGSPAAAEPAGRRSDYGFERTTCACRRCAVCCEHTPGALSPVDLPRIAAHLGYGADVARFARDHLLASDGTPVRTDRGRVVTLRTLIPAATPDGRCKFLAGGRCAIHAVSPFGCAYFDAHQSDRDAALRTDALYRALHDDWQSGGVVARTWTDLHAAGLDAPPTETRVYRLTKAMRREKLL